LFGGVYINPSSNRSKENRVKAGKLISYVKLKNKRKKEIILVNRIKNIIKKGNYFYKLYLFMKITKKYSKPKIRKFFIKHKLDVFFYFNFKDGTPVTRELIRKKLKNNKQLECNYPIRRKTTSKIIKQKFHYICKRSIVYQNKRNRSEKSTKLHTDKHKYRTDVNRFTIQSIKNHNIPNIEKRDKYNWNLDHLVPIMVGFHKKIPPELIGDYRNLEVIPKIDNIKKRMNISEKYDKELFKEYL